MLCSSALSLSKLHHERWGYPRLKVSEPLTSVGRKDLDFGQGFYVTNDRQQAIDWSITKASRKKFVESFEAIVK